MKESIKKNYPNAEKGSRITETCIERLSNEFHFNLQKTLMATSVCSDEVIRSATDFRGHLGIENPFQLGGLAGYPFAGLTGLKAFLSHVPNDGYAMILFGPHIGVTTQGEIGYMKRKGQTEKSGCCGALQAITGSLKKMKNESKADPELDYQLWKIESDLRKKNMDIEGDQEPLVSVTNQTYQFIYEKLTRLTDISPGLIGKKRLALIGGIIINTDHGFDDWFDLQCFKVI